MFGRKGARGERGESGTAGLEGVGGAVGAVGNPVSISFRYFCQNEDDLLSV